MTTSRSLPRTLLGMVAVAGLLAALILVSNPSPKGPEIAGGGDHAQVSAVDSANGPVAMGNGVFMGGALKHDTSKELRSIPGDPVRALPADGDEGDADGGDADQAGPHGADTVVQSTLSSPAMPGTSKNFDGVGFPGVACNCAPPDTNGEVGSTQYVQIVNEGYQVWNKSTGASVLGPVGITTIWSGFGGVCQSNGDGDPVVLYDQIANRWLVSQFAGASVPTDECIAISQTSDATGAYYRYDFHLGSNFFDYPHLSVWPDGYYMSDNVFNSSGTAYLGAQPFVFDRARMLQGLSATFQTTAPMGSGSDAMLPADLDGSTLPPAGAPATFVAWPSGFTYKTFHYHVDWVTPGNSTFTTFAAPAAAPFTALCQTTRACVPQSGQPSSSNLDALADRPMFRLTYRNFGDHESVVGNLTVSSGGVAGIRWFELRNVTNGPETVFQQSTYQPDSTWRWMGSAAMDGNGNIAIGFSASSGSIFPQLRYAGRLAGDPLNTLAQGEATLIAGTGSQQGTSNRWGDYADMTVDPVDDCTFWFTSEYYSVTSQFNWRTRIASFTMPGCGSSPTTGSIAGHVADSNGGAAIAGATITLSPGGTTTTDGSGSYSFSNLTPQGYTVTASKTGYTTSAPANVTVTAGNTTTQDFTLVAIASGATGWFYANASAAGTGGDGNGYETNRTLLTGAPNGGFATDANSGSANSTTCPNSARDSEVVSYAVPAVGSTILGIQVQVTGKSSSNANTPRFCVQLSWDGGTTWTSGETTANLKTTSATHSLGSASDTWGHGWTAAQLSSATFRVRVIDLANSTSRTFSLDAVGVNVTYQ
jgi:Carboxypeptidase regulatory-like domain